MTTDQNTTDKPLVATVETVEYVERELVIVWDEDGEFDAAVDLDTAKERYQDQIGNDGLRMAATIKIRLPKLLAKASNAVVTINPIEVDVSTD